MAARCILPVAACRQHPSAVHQSDLVPQAQPYLYGVELHQRWLPHKGIIRVDNATSVDINTKVLQGSAATPRNEHVGMARAAQHR